MAFTSGNANGSAITNYQYNLNGGSFVSMATITSPFSITGLSTGILYAITLQAINSNGTSTASSSVSTTTTIPITPPISYYQLSSNTTDTGSSPNNGFSGSVGYDTYYSKTGLSLYRSNTSQLVLNSGLSISTGFTMSFWFANVGSTVNVNWLMKNGSSLILIALEFDSYLNSVVNFSSVWFPPKYQTFASGTVSNSQWHHVVLVFTNTGLTFYVDANSLTATTVGGTLSAFLFSASGNYLIFDRTTNTSTNNTAFRNLGFYNYQLTSANVSTLYAQGLSST
jgi:hypothetical protein